MDTLAAGQFQIDDWIQIIIVILIIGGSVFGAVAKKLIKTFTPQESPREPTRGSPAGVGHTRPGVPPRPVQPAPPVARPMPTAGQYPTAPVPRPPTREKLPRPPVPVHPTIARRRTSEPPGKPPVSRSRPEPTRQGTPRPQPTARPISSRPRAAQRPATTEERLGHLTSAMEQTGGLDEAAAEQRLGHVESAVAQRGERLESAMEQRLGHVEPGPEKKPATARGGLYIPVLGRAAPQNLRQAILLREILGPPIALRRHDDDLF